MGKKTPPFSEYEKWTEAKFFGWIRGSLRKAYTRWPPKFETIDNAKRKSKSKNKRLSFEFQCAECTKWYGRRDVEVDHIIPCGSLKCWADIPLFAKNLFVSADKLRVVCKPCHLKKTAADRKAKEKESV
jgi:5-methylcytosine-specific restriction endonuclease McrA